MLFPECKVTAGKRKTQKEKDSEAKIELEGGKMESRSSWHCVRKLELIKITVSEVSAYFLVDLPFINVPLHLCHVFLLTLLCICPCFGSLEPFLYGNEQMTSPLPPLLVYNSEFTHAGRTTPQNPKVPL
jgi:hypothetical protein